MNASKTNKVITWVSTRNKGATQPGTKWVPPGDKMEVVLNQRDLNSGEEYRSSNQLS